MKKRILFVDDEPNVLNGLQRMLRTMRGEWELSFLEGGEKALEEMANQEFDVVVSDMRMPGMNGAQFLREVMARHPTTVRIVLSGHAERELVAQCVGVAHQYISKPCDPDQLKALIQNAISMGSGLVDVDIKRIVGTIERLPSVPHLFRALTQAVMGQETSSDAVARIIEQDVGMTAHVLKLVNSSFYGLRRNIETVLEAVTFLGFDTLKSLVLADAVFGNSPPLPTRSISLEDLWVHSVRVAKGARHLAQLEGLSKQEESEAFVSGILHDLGILVLASNFSNRYDPILAMVSEEKIGLTTAELWEVGVTHSEVGAYLLGLWGIPAPILRVVSLHHRPQVALEERFSPLVAVHVADSFSAKEGGNPAFNFSKLDSKFLKELGLDQRVGLWRDHLESLYSESDLEAP